MRGAGGGGGGGGRAGGGGGGRRERVAKLNCGSRLSILVVHGPG